MRTINARPVGRAGGSQRLFVIALMHLIVPLKKSMRKLYGSLRIPSGKTTTLVLVPTSRGSAPDSDTPGARFPTNSHSVI